MVTPPASGTIARFDPRTKPGTVYVALCALVLSAGLIGVRSAGWNAIIVQAHEFVFALGYVFYRRVSSHGDIAVKALSIPYVFGAVWALSVTASLIWSPLGMGTEFSGHLRYQQTLLHVMFFLALRDLLVRHPLPRQWVLLAIPAASLAVALAMAVLALRLDAYDTATAGDWFNSPPLNGHIRYTGYQAAAAIAALLAFLLVPRRAPGGTMALFVALVALCTFLFWMGGRASILSVCAAFAFLAMVAAAKGMGGRARTLWIAFSLAMIIGLALAEALAVFPWNGVLSSVTRTVEAENLTQVTSGRLDLWREAWESVRPHLAFGLGPQGYLVMPNRSFGVQPHSMLVQFVVEWGLVGAVLFLGLLVYGFWRGLVAHVVAARAPLDTAALSAGAIIVALTALGLVDGTYYHPQPSLYLAVAFAVWTLPRGATAEAANPSKSTDRSPAVPGLTRGKLS